MQGSEARTARTPTGSPKAIICQHAHAWCQVNKQKVWVHRFFEPALVHCARTMLVCLEKFPHTSAHKNLKCWCMALHILYYPVMHRALQKYLECSNKARVLQCLMYILRSLHCFSFLLFSATWGAFASYKFAYKRIQIQSTGLSLCTGSSHRWTTLKPPTPSKSHIFSAHESLRKRSSLWAQDEESMPRAQTHPQRVTRVQGSHPEAKQ